MIIGTATGTDAATAFPTPPLGNLLMWEVDSVPPGSGIMLPYDVDVTVLLRIRNAGANPLRIYPIPGGTIDQSSDPYILQSSYSIELWAVTSSDWITSDLLESVFPPQAGNAGKYLTTDGDTLSWGTPAGSGLPSGTAGQIIVTDGATAYFDSSAVEVKAGSSPNATGSGAVVLGGNGSSASGVSSVSAGLSCVASGGRSAAFGSYATASGDDSFAAGNGPTASGSYSFAANGATAAGDNSAAFGLNARAAGGGSAAFGQNSVADCSYKMAFSDGGFVATTGNRGDGQFTMMPLSAFLYHGIQQLAPLTITGGGGGGQLFPIRNNFTYFIFAIIGARHRDGSASAMFLRYFAIRNNGGATSLVGSVGTLGADINAPGWTVDVQADDTNDALRIDVGGDPGGTPPSSEIFWQAELFCIEIGS